VTPWSRADFRDYQAKGYAMTLNPAGTDDQRAELLERSRMAWNGRAASWDAMFEERPDARATELERALVALELSPGMRLLDAGCGTGQWAVGFANHGCEVTAIDFAPEMLARARAHAQQAGVSIQFREGDIAVIDDPDATYDAIHCRCAIQFNPDPAAVLRQFQRLLVPGGRLFISVPGALSPIYQQSWRRFVEPVPFNNHLVPWELESLLHELNWAVLDGWGAFMASGNGAPNVLAGTGGSSAALSEEQIQRLPEPIQQAVSTLWITIAAVPAPKPESP
jgi:SAM-dependent methyltransferase